MTLTHWIMLAAGAVFLVLVVTGKLDRFIGGL